MKFEFPEIKVIAFESNYRFAGLGDDDGDIGGAKSDEEWD